MKLIVMQNFSLTAKLIIPMYDEFPELASCSSRRTRTFHRGEIIETDRFMIPVPERISLDPGYGTIICTEPVPEEKIICLTRRNRHAANLFSKKMEDARYLQDEMEEAEFRVNLSTQEIPEADSVDDVMAYSRICSRNQAYQAKYQFRMDSVLNQAYQYERLLVRAGF